jgi:molybdopterin synthase sulfur carrier subunit
MAISVRFFAALRERVHLDSLSLDINGELDLRDLVVMLGRRFGEDFAVALNAPNIRVALNHEFVSGQRTLRDGDEVAFMPPITGG